MVEAARRSSWLPSRHGLKEIKYAWIGTVRLSRRSGSAPSQGSLARRFGSALAYCGRSVAKPLARHWGSGSGSEALGRACRPGLGDRRGLTPCVLGLASVLVERGDREADRRPGQRLFAFEPAVAHRGEPAPGSDAHMTVLYRPRART